MNDLELTKACAEAMGHPMFEEHGIVLVSYLKAHKPWRDYCPLHDDAQAMALLKKFSIQVHHHGFAGATASLVTVQGRMKLDDVPTKICTNNLNRAICECVALLSKHAKGS